MIKKYLVPAALLTVVVIAAVWILSGTLGIKTGPGISGDLSGHNLIIIAIDALRADHLGCYGYHRDTSPFIDRLARQGIVFNRALSNSSFTQESVAVILTGRLPSSSGSTGWGAYPAKNLESIGEIYQKAGYENGFFSNTNVLKNPNFSRGFKKVWHCDKWGVSGNAPKLSQIACSFIENHKDKKFMMYLHYLDPHGPYNPPQKYYLLFAKSIFPNPVGVYKDVRKNCETLIKKGFGPGEERYEDMVLRYDAEIAHVDSALQLIFETLEKHHLSRKTLVVITADHGEEFLEHDYVEHAWTLYNESLHVPLIIWAPACLRPGRIPQLVSSVDILPTLLELMKIPRKKKDFDGSLLFKADGENFVFSPPSKPYIGELLIQHRSLLRAVIKDNWKYIAGQKWLAPENRPCVLNRTREIEKNEALHTDIWGPVIFEEMYDLSKDPGEKLPLDSEAKHRLLEYELLKYKKYCKQKKVVKSTEKKHPAMSEKDKEKLKSLGYLQ